MATPSILIVPDRYKSGVLYSQLPEDGSGDLTFTRASAATRVNASGLIESVASGVPRLDYSGGGCPSLLLEPQRTNLVTFSEQLDNAAWTKASATISANVATSPAGFTDADKLIPSSGLVGTIQQIHNITASQSSTMSIFAKAAGIDNIKLNSRTADGINDASITFNLSSGTISIAAASTGGFTSPSGTITNYGNDWYRLTLTHATTLTTATRVRFFSEEVGDGTKGLLLWGAQFETNASYATSYIPTLGASVTRGADVCSKTGVSGFIGQQEGVLYAEILRTQSTANDLFWITLSDGSINNWLFFGTEGTGGRFYVRASNTVIFDQYPAISLGRHKLALAYKSGSIAVYIDGAQLFTSSASFTIGSLTGFALGQNQSTLTGSVDTAGGVIASAVYPTRLTNAELAALTTL